LYFINVRGFNFPCCLVKFCWKMCIFDQFSAKHLLSHICIFLKVGFPWILQWFTMSNWCWLLTINFCLFWVSLPSRNLSCMLCMKLWIEFCLELFMLVFVFAFACQNSSASISVSLVFILSLFSYKDSSHNGA